MDLIRPACAGLAAWLAAWYAEPLLVLRVVTRDQLSRSVDRALIVIVPELTIAFLVAMLAAYAHRAPFRDDKRRHATAVLGTVALITALTLAAGLIAAVQPWTLLTRLSAELTGGAAAWALLARTRTLRSRAAARGSYY